MKINISGLSEGTHRTTVSGPAHAMELGPNFTGEVTATITLEKSIHQILAQVNASVKGVFICDRCANEFEREITAKFTSVYSWEKGEEQEEDDDFHLLGPDDNIIDVTKSVREYLLLAVPVKMLCRETCEVPVPLLNETPAADPRWEKLRQLGNAGHN